MITLSLVVYLGISLLLMLPFMLRYLVVLRNERHSSGKGSYAPITADSMQAGGNGLF